MIFSQLIIPKYYKEIVPTERGRGLKNYIIGCDSETIEGKPLTFQFYSEDFPLEEIIYTNPETATADFLSMCDMLPNVGGHYIFYCHNVQFDFVEFFYDHKIQLSQEEFEIEHGKYLIKGVYSSTSFAQIFHKSKRKKIFIIDTLAFFRATLAKLAKMFCPDLPKLEMPKGLGSKKFKPGNKKFEAYAMRDAIIAYHVGKALDIIHADFDISQSFSIAHMASKIFKHHFMDRHIPLPPKSIVYSSMYAYHGGKNNLTVKPMTEHKNVYSLDIVSAYPFAMSTFPSFSVLEAYKGLQSYGNVKKVPDLGVYSVCGRVKDCKYPIIYNHKFKPVHGKIFKLWVTGFELNEAIQSQEILIESVYGYYYDTDLDPYNSPFAGYVKYFFNLKDTEKDPVKRYFYKILLNSLYGKFIQTYKEKHYYEYDLNTDELEDLKVLRTGAMFNPFIAALITGHTRAYIHKIEHKYNALHTSTDGIFCTKVPKTFDSKLGGLTKDNEGTLCIFRNKLYFMKHPKTGHTIKYAKHGFRGDIKLLRKIWKSGVREYEFVQCNKLKESIRRNLQVNKFEKRRGTIHIKGE